MYIETTSYVYRDKYLFGKLVHNTLCSIFGESCVFRRGLAIEEEIKIEVTAYYIPGDPGKPSWDPELYDPPTCEEIEDILATHNGKPLKLTAEEEDQIMEELLEVGRAACKEAFDPPDHYYDEMDGIW
jgi:hypothetical protein